MRNLKKVFVKFIPHEIFKLILNAKYAMLPYLYILGSNRCYPHYLKAMGVKKVAYSDESKCKEIRWGQAFYDYNSCDYASNLKLMWTEDPCPGNYGDWLSPYIITKVSKRGVVHVSGINNSRVRHLIALGSVIDCANKNSVVIGAGIDNKNAKLDNQANYISVRGKYTAKRLKELTGIEVHRFGDIGFLLRRLYTPKEREEKNKSLLVRHVNQSFFPVELPEDYKEFSIFAAKKDDIEAFIDEIYNSSLVVTSAMHCFITCISYGVPCKLISFSGEEIKVPGDGIKFLDALSGVNLPEIKPKTIEIGPNMFDDIDDVVPYTHKVSNVELDKIVETIKMSLENI